MVILATLATATVFHRLGWGGGTGTKVIAMILVVGLTIFGGVMGFDLIMRMQTWITIVTGVFSVVFIALVAHHIHWHTVSAVHSGSAEAVIGALVFVITGFGLGWVNVAADYSRTCRAGLQLKKRRQKMWASSNEPKRAGKLGRYLRVRK